MSTNSTNYQKHASTNPIQRWLINRFYDQLLATISHLNIKTILDAGCGEGFTISRLEKTFPGKYIIHGIDNTPQAITIAQNFISPERLQTADIHSLPFPDNSFELVICTEVLEHLHDPSKALKEIHRVSQTYALLSVPHEPWFRVANFLRGKHLSRFGNHPEHIQNWTSHSFNRLVKNQGFTITKTLHPFPWTILLAHKHPPRL